MIDHPRSVGVGLNLRLKFRVDEICTHKVLRFLKFWHLGLKLPIHAFFGGGGVADVFLTNGITSHLLVRNMSFEPLSVCTSAAV